jgi:hypothetical protein
MELMVCPAPVEHASGVSEPTMSYGTIHLKTSVAEERIDIAAVRGQGVSNGGGINRQDLEIRGESLQAETGLNWPIEMLTAGERVKRSQPSWK